MATRAQQTRAAQTKAKKPGLQTSFDLPLSGQDNLPLTPRQRLAWLRLIRSENVGPITFRKLINRYGSAERALDEMPALARNGGLRRDIRMCELADAEAELAQADAAGLRLVASGEPDYPAALAATDNPPPLIYLSGNAAIARKEIIAIVGARNGSAAGKKFARTLALELGAADYAIASGLALGIDAAAHDAALATGTIAVVAGGIDVVYPPEHAALHAQLCEAGLIYSEMPPGFRPRSQDFPRRNRIISGISIATIIVEAAARSGSLITARCAADQGRDVFAVPGNPLDPRAVGTNRLIRDGAVITTSAQDVIDHLTSDLARGTHRQSRIAEPHDDELTEHQDSDTYDDAMLGPTASDRERVLAALSTTPIEADELVRATALTVPKVKCALLELNLAGRLEYHQGQTISLRPA